MKVLSALLTLAFLAAPATAGDRLKVRVTYAAQLAPVNIQVQAIVEPSDENRHLEVVAESESFYRASAIQLNGSRAARVNCFTFTQIPAGSYEVCVRVLAADGSELACVRDAMLIGG